MRISRLRVDGFGALRDVEVSLDGDMAVVEGPNEAGKSTLVHFLSGVLFGFPRKGHPAHHPPVRGGRH
ncbi:MAG: ATP-binding protein, partial [Acidimicrobiales bacterium]